MTEDKTTIVIERGRVTADVCGHGRFVSAYGTFAAALRIGDAELRRKVSDVYGPDVERTLYKVELAAIVADWATARKENQ